MADKHEMAWMTVSSKASLGFKHSFAACRSQGIRWRHSAAPAVNFGGVVLLFRIMVSVNIQFVLHPGFFVVFGNLQIQLADARLHICTRHLALQ